MQIEKVIEPGATIGILGDGQLARMTALAAAHMGYKVAVLGPGGKESPAGQVSYWAGSWQNESDVQSFAAQIAVATIDWENVPISYLRAVEQAGVPLRPGIHVLEVARDRLLEKSLAQELGIPTPRFRDISIEADLESIVDFPFPGILKTRHNGYDGKGQIACRTLQDVWDAWKKLNQVPCILEEFVEFRGELSYIVARAPNETHTTGFGPFENRHKNGILDTTIYPARFSEEVQTRVRAYAARIASNLNAHGLLAVEFFVTKDRTVLFNEMAPRPHNSGHLTIECCRTSQFAQLVRCICNLPYGSSQFHSFGKMQNLIGSDVENCIAQTSTHSNVHVYGKGEHRPGRKMGHIVTFE